MQVKYRCQAAGTAARRGQAAGTAARVPFIQRQSCPQPCRAWSWSTFAAETSVSSCRTRLARSRSRSRLRRQSTHRHHRSLRLARQGGQPQRGACVTHRPSRRTDSKVAHGRISACSRAPGTAIWNRSADVQPQAAALMRCEPPHQHRPTAGCVMMPLLAACRSGVDFRVPLSWYGDALRALPLDLERDVL